MNDVLFIVADLMVPATESVTVRDTVGTARGLMTAHNLAVLPVLDEDRIVGLVTPIQLLDAPPYRPVTEVMKLGGVTPATPDLPLAQAYLLMVNQDVQVLPVVQDGKLVGQISATGILRVQGQQTDPLTDLPLSTAVRAWAVAALERGHEVSILFFDLDNFGAVNKRLSHVAGDNMLCTVARLLGSFVDVHTDFLGRYGGDEFVIATTRREADARALMNRIQDVVAFPIEAGEETRRVTVSAGMAGGRRAEGRPRAHIAATVDDLLTLASRASTAAKEAKRGAQAGAPEGPPPSPPTPAEATLPRTGRSMGPRLRLVRVAVDSDNEGSTATVTLRLDAREGVGRAAGRAGGPARLFLVAEATLDAIRRTAGETHAYVLEELHTVPRANETVATVVLRAPKQTQVFVGAACGVDAAQAVAKAVLAALNRRLARQVRT